MLPLPVSTGPLTKFGAPSEAMLWGAEPVLTHCQRTLPPTATVSTAAFTDLLRSLRKKLFPTVTRTVPASGGDGITAGTAVVELPHPERAAINSPPTTRVVVFINEGSHTPRS